MKTKLILSIAFLWAIGATAFAQSPSASPAKSTAAPYNEGHVWTLTMVKTKTGLDDDYFRQITNTVKPIYAEEKKQNIILDYKILMGDPHGRDEANIIIMVEYANMAAFDGLREKTDPLLEKVMGNQDQQRDMAVKRLDIREILGTRTMREITLK
ncbi:MAG: hypothetical protein QOG48_1511 [Verrucomicrobiota bacterium]|jgi:hypothetical protein